LGASRLSILDLTNFGNQPFITEDGEGILVYNGEVYNHNDLKKELTKAGESFQSRCDTEVVLKALHRWGPKLAIERFNGMFVFAYYDKRNRTVWLGRDPSGIKPLYIARSGNVFAFASEMKALFEHPSIPCRPDMHSITTYIMMNRLDRWAPFENIEEVQAGKLVSVSNGIETSFYYFDPLRDVDVTQLSMDNGSILPEKTEELEALMPKCVESHLQSDAPLAMMCSGGVDSSLITHHASQYLDHLTAYVIDVDGMNGTEVERAKKVCDPLDVDLRRIPVNREKYLELWPKSIYFSDEPIYFQQTVLHMAVAQRAHIDGFKVLVCGEGADELFGGYGWQTNAWDMWHKRRIRAAWLKRIEFLKPVMQKVWKTALLYDYEALQSQPFVTFDSLLKKSRDLRRVAAIDGGQRYIRQREWLKKLENVGEIEDRMYLTKAFEDFAVHLATTLKSNDRTSMAYSIESRVPFLDKRLIEFGLHLPRHLKYDGKTSKMLLKKAASKHLPNEIVYAKKIGFGFDSAHWQGTKEILKGGMVEEMLKWSSKQREQQHDLIRQDGSLQFHLTSLEIWARIFLDGQSPEKLTEELGKYTHAD
jgi:asparagine synthase (glutamine-hydrolysing)